MGAKVLGDLRERHTLFAAAGHAHDVVTELLGIGSRHSNILPGRPAGKPDQVSPIRAAVPILFPLVLIGLGRV